MSAQLSVKLEPNEKLKKFLGALEREGCKLLFAGGAARLRADVQAHLKRYAANHHASAQAAGAAPTGHLEKAAQSIEQESSADSASVTVRSPGITRAFGTVHIRPRKAKALTIPMPGEPLAYGHTAYEVSRRFALFRIKTHAGDAALAANVEGELRVFYLLKRHAILRQERALLPSDGELTASVAKGVLSTLRLVLQGGAS